MARSSIQIIIPNMFENQHISFQANLNGNISTYKISWYKDQTNKNLIIQGNSPFDILEESSVGYTRPFYDAIEYAGSIEGMDFLDYFDTSRSGNVVTIQSRIDNLMFENGVSNNNGVSFVITNQNSQPLFLITESKILSATSDMVTYQVTTTEQATKMTYPISQNINSNPITYSYLRGQSFKLSLEKEPGVITNIFVRSPLKLLALDISVKTVVSNLGNSAAIIYTPLNSPDNLALNVEYSIDGINYGTNNVFPNLSVGSHTAYVKDQYGVVVQKNFELKQSISKEPIFKVSIINSIRYAKQEKWDGKNIYKNDKNTLSDQTLSLLSHRDIQRFQINDVIPTQIESNYEVNKAFVIHENGEFELNVRKVISLVNEKDYRDCIIYKSEEGKARIKFERGNLYDYSSGIKTGEYDLSGSRLYWLKKGTTVELDGVGVLEINKSLYDENAPNGGGFIIELDYNYTSSATISKIKSIYDIRPYNVYEFNTDFGPYKDQKIRVRIEATDSVLPKQEYLSELIDVREIHKKCLCIEYYFKNKNYGLYYETGIKNKLRIPFEKIEDSSKGKVTTETGDTIITLTNAEYYEGDKIIFKPVSKEISKKLELALIHEFVLINNIQRVIKSETEKEPLEDSNLYIVTADMAIAGSAITSNPVIDISNNEVSELPKLIEANGKFISYE